MVAVLQPVDTPCEQYPELSGKRWRLKITARIEEYKRAQLGGACNGVQELFGSEVRDNQSTGQRLHTLTSETVDRRHPFVG